jgi:3-dehydroquinate dehydratase/shikimate dehydrogenase
MTGREACLDELKDRINNFPGFIHEIRLDFLKNSATELRFLDNEKLILTLRSPEHGGNFSGTEDEALSVLREAAALNPFLIDVEFPKPLDFINSFCKKNRVLFSYHDTQKIPENLEEIVKEMDAASVHMLKVAVKVNDTADLLRLYELTEHTKHPLVLIGMGSCGILSRILYRRFHSPLTFISRFSESETGLISIDDACNFRIGANENFRPLGVMGAAHVLFSPGVRIYNKIFKQRNLNYVYVPVPTLKPAKTLELIGELGFHGLSVTMPHKESMMSHCSAMSENARKIGAVNTLKRSSNGWFGENTDCEGVKHALEEMISLSGRKIAVFGAGGAARAVIHAMIESDASVTVFCRNREKVQENLKNFPVDVEQLEKIRTERFDILINATPAGMENDASPINDYSKLKGRIVMDLVTRPLQTRLIRESKKAGAAVITGEKMWIRQGMSQLKLWTGQDFSFDEIYEKGSWND